MQSEGRQLSNNHRAGQSFRESCQGKPLPMLPWFPIGVSRSAVEKTSHDPSAHSFLTLSRVREPFLKLDTTHTHTNTPSRRWGSKPFYSTPAFPERALECLQVGSRQWRFKPVPYGWESKARLTVLTFPFLEC